MIAGIGEGEEEVVGIKVVELVMSTVNPSVMNQRPRYTELIKGR